MHRSMRLPLLAAMVVGCSLVFAGGASAFPVLPGVPSAQPKTVGVSDANVVSAGLGEIEVARGSMPLDGGTASNPYYGYDGNQPNMLPAFGSNVEATKTEPDKNTYLVLSNQSGPDSHYDYGTHFLFQG